MLKLYLAGFALFTAALFAGSVYQALMASFAALVSVAG